MADGKDSEGIPASADSSNAGTEAQAPVRRRWLRIVLLALGPVAIAVGGGYVYMNSGRIVETDNAYVKADVVIVSAEVSGAIVEIAVSENQTVHAGDLLLRIDDDPYVTDMDRAESQVEAVRSFIGGLFASYRQRLEELKLAQSNMAFAERELEREQSLAARELASESDLDTARHEYDVARQQIPIIEQALAQLEAQLGPSFSGSIESHPAYRTVAAMLDVAALNLKRTRIQAPIDGVASRVPVAGGYVPAGGPVMSIVSDRGVWIEANFKETQLTHVAVGQPVTVTVDAYPGEEWQGIVESISQATGSEFSVIPAQNASGNWVKVAQRIPVRISLETGSEDRALRAGMSVTAAVDTGFRRPAPKHLGFLAALRSER